MFLRGRCGPPKFDRWKRLVGYRVATIAETFVKKPIAADQDRERGAERPRNSTAALIPLCQCERTVRRFVRGSVTAVGPSCRIAAALLYLPVTGTRRAWIQAEAWLYGHARRAAVDPARTAATNAKDCVNRYLSAV